jgi:hypothetical protein
VQRLDDFGRILGWEWDEAGHLPSSRGGKSSRRRVLGRAFSASITPLVNLIIFLLFGQAGPACLLIAANPSCAVPVSR